MYSVFICFSIFRDNRESVLCIEGEKMDSTHSRRKLSWTGTIILMVLLTVWIGAAGKSHASEQQVLVDKARLTVESYLSDPDFAWFNNHMKGAKALLIIPQLLKGAFFVGASGGSGVLITRDDKTGNWSPPAFYTMGSASFGLQFGGQSSELILMVMTPKGVKAFLKASFKFVYLF